MNYRATSGPDAVLFDLDGTLLDTAPDMVGALNALCGEHGRPIVPFATARPHVSNGAAGLLRLSWADFDAALQADVHRRYLDLYAERLAQETRLFPSIGDILDSLEERGIPWGVVTNKPSWLTEPLLSALGLFSRSSCTISGDTLPERKPHPRPVRYALDRLGANPARSFYVGDARRDIESGKAAGTITVAVRYGYIEPGQDPQTWGADHLIESTEELAHLLNGRL